MSNATEVINKIAKTFAGMIIINEYKINLKEIHPLPSNAEILSQVIMRNTAYYWNILSQIEYFLTNIYNYSNMTCQALIIALIYIDRVIAKEKIFVNTNNFNTLLVSTLSLAMKYHQDYYNVSQFSLISGISKKAIAAAEISVLNILDFSCFISGGMFLEYTKNISFC